jgi:two-component system, NtrC family, sensor kinase
MLFARQTQPKKAAANINQVIQQALSLVESRLSSGGVLLDLKLGDNIPETVMDSSQFVQIIINLVVNAAQAMPEGGKLTIQTRCDENTLVLTVQDSGTGMTETIRQQIFLPFFTTKDVDQGTGLGLSVVHGIVLAHNGTIDVQSEPGSGTTFTIRIPIIRNTDDGEGTNE